MSYQGKTMDKEVEKKLEEALDILEFEDKEKKDDESEE